FSSANPPLSATFSGVIDLTPGPAASIIAWGVADVVSVLPPDTLAPAVRVIDKVGNGIPGVSVSWTVTDGSSVLDNSNKTASSQTDADGIARPGLWILPAGAVGPFTIVASPSGPPLENAPLTLSAILSLAQSQLRLPDGDRPSASVQTSSTLVQASSSLERAGRVNQTEPTRDCR